LAANLRKKNDKLACLEYKYFCRYFCRGKMSGKTIGKRRGKSSGTCRIICRPICWKFAATSFASLKHQNVKSIN